MAMKLTTENVDHIERQMLNDIDLWEEDGERSKLLLAYIGGVHDMANAVRKAIVELGRR